MSIGSLGVATDTQSPELLVRAQTAPSSVITTCSSVPDFLPNLCPGNHLADMLPPFTFPHTRAMTLLPNSVAAVHLLPLHHPTGGLRPSAPTW